MSNFRPKIRQALMALALAVLGGMGCESVPVEPQGVPYEDVICEVSAGVSGHFEGPDGELPCSRTDPTACNGQPSKCYTMAFGMCGSSTSLDYTCVVDRGNGQTCTGNLQCATRACNGGTCGQPVTPPSDMTTTPTPPDMTGTPSCSFERQDVCQEGVHCLPKPGQAADNTTECRLETAMVKATSTAGANNVSIECSDGAGTLNVIKPKVGEWAICPAPTNKAAKALGNDRLYVAVAGAGQIKSYPAGTSVPLL